MIVMKFGGKCLSTAQKIEQICKYIKTRLSEQIVVVVSAQGDTTDKLLEQAEMFNATDKREIDGLIATGEMQSAALFSLALQKIGVKAKSFLGFQLPILTSDNHGSALIKKIGINKILSCINSGTVAVVAGFQGINDNNEICTLGRGGSDTTAVALGVALNCKVEIYSDFDGIYTGDPRRNNFVKLKKISYEDMLELSKNGAKVLSTSASLLASLARAKVECKGAQTPFEQGTELVQMPQPFAGINVNDELSLVSICYNSNFNINKLLNYITKNLHYVDLSISKTCIKVMLTKEDAKKLEKYFNKLTQNLNQEQQKPHQI